MLYTLVTKLNSTWSTLLKVDLKVDKVDRVALAPYTLATKLLTVPATKSTVSHWPRTHWQHSC